MNRTESTPSSRLLLALVLATTAGALTEGATAAPAPPGRPPAAERVSRERLWREVAARPDGSGRRPVRTFELNERALAAMVAGAPLESAGAAEAGMAEITLPGPDGKLVRFRFVESPLLAPALAARFPEIRTYRGWGIDDPSTTVRFTRTSGGLHAHVRAATSSFHVAPVARGDATTHASYDWREAVAGADDFECAVDRPGGGAHVALSRSQAAAAAPFTVPIRTYRLAVAATGEYTQFHGGTVDAAMNNGIVPTLNTIAGIFENELSVRFELVAGEDRIIQTDPLGDPYEASTPSDVLGENQEVLDDEIGEDHYDIGHVFDGRNMGGIATLGVVCNDGDEGRGMSSSTTPSGPAFDLRVAHEMGHQFEADHTFNGTMGACAGNREPDSAVEPGSGSTIMSYAGRCASDNIVGGRDPYFHVLSLIQMTHYIVNDGTCAANTATNNFPPFVNAGSTHMIPTRTPFVLTATGSNPPDPNERFSWEQLDAGAASAPTVDVIDNPLFRSFPATASPSRTFPQMGDVLANTSTPGETLPTTDRILSMVVSARDNQPGGGAFSYDQVTIAVDDAAGPFVVTQPAAGSIWTATTSRTVTWDVAGTDLSPISTANVSIRLSLDNGGSFPIVLAASTPNDGMQSVFIPAVTTSQTARIRVEAVGNVFFNVSAYFTVIPAPQITPTGSLSVTRGGPSVTGPVMTVSDGQDAPGDLAVTLNGSPADLTVQLAHVGATVSATVRANCNLAVRTHPVWVRVENTAGLSDIDKFDVVVADNLAPTLGPYPNTTVVAGTTGFVIPVGQPADPNGNAPSVAVSPTFLAGGTTLSVASQRTGEIRVVAGAGAAATTHVVTVTATDNCQRSTTRSFSLTIARTPPTIVGLGTYPVTTQGGTSAPLDVARVSDLQDAAANLVPMGVNLPPGISFAATNANGTVSVRATAACTVTAQTYPGELRVTDSDGMAATLPLQVAVNPNPPPMLGTYLDTGVTQGSTVVVYPSAAPADPNNTVSLSVTPNILQGGGLVWTNPNGQVTVQTFAGTTPRTYTVLLTATDTCGATATRTFKLTVRPLACATERNALYAADTGNDRIQRFNGIAWGVVGSMVGGSGLGQFRAPEAVVASADNRVLYVADTGNRRIQWSQNGGGTWAVFASGLTPTGLALDRDGHLYVSEAGEHRVSRYHGGIPGTPVALATAGNGAGRVSNPNGLAIDCRMTLYVADTGHDRILSILTADAAMIANTGTVVASAGAGLNPAQVSRPQGVAVNNAGTLFVADTGNDRILQFGAALPGPAAALCTAGTAVGQVDDPEGVAIGALMAGPFAGGSSVMIGDTGNDRIEGIRMPVAANVWALVPPPMGGGPGSAVGQFKDPSKVR
jgi:hypothetical protein